MISDTSSCPYEGEEKHGKPSMGFRDVALGLRDLAWMYETGKMRKRNL